jgi:hypothetical protein
MSSNEIIELVILGYIAIVVTIIATRQVGIQMDITKTVLEIRKLKRNEK